MIFYQWFLAELIAALRRLEFEQAESVEAVASTPDSQTVVSNGRSRNLPKQANQVARPRQRVTTILVDGAEYLLGDGSRVQVRRHAAQGMVPALGAPHSIPCPPMPLVSPACGVRIDEPAVPAPPSFPYRLADDHYLDAGYEREGFGEGTVLCGFPVEGRKPVELTGFYVQPDRDPCSLESRVRLDHMAYRRRPSIRMPYMAGVDSGRYLRVVVIPMKSCRQYDPGTPT